MRCVNCSNKKDLKPSVIRSHHFTESGLDSVYLKGLVRQYKCDQCGEKYTQYANIDAIHKKIAEMLIEKDAPLTCGELRYLRKYMGLSAEALGALVEYRHESLYRYEAGDWRIPTALDLAIRRLASTHTPDRDYKKHDNQERKRQKVQRMEISRSNARWSPAHA